MRRYIPFAIIAAVLFLGIASGILVYQWKQQQQPPETIPVPPVAEETSRESPTAVTPGSEEPATVATTAPTAAAIDQLHIRGGASARVTLEEYGDFQCQPCREVFPILTTLEHEYGDRLRVIFRHKPLSQHEHAVLAARAAEAAGLQGKFWEMHDLLYENAERWTKGVETVGPDAPPSRRLESNVLGLEGEVRDVFIRYAEILKLDVERFKHDLDSDQVKERVEADAARGKSLGIDRTPTIYVNGNRVPTPVSHSEEGLRALIDSALAGKTNNAPQTPSPAVRAESK